MKKDRCDGKQRSVGTGEGGCEFGVLDGVVGGVGGYFLWWLVE